MTEQEIKEKSAALHAAIEKHGRLESGRRVDQDRQLSQVQDALDALVAVLASRDAESHQLSETIRSEYRSLEEALSGFDLETVAKLESALTESQAYLRVANERMADLDRTVETRTQEAHDAYDRVTDLKQTVEAKDQETRDAQERVTELENAIRETSDALKTAQADLAQARVEIDRERSLTKDVKAQLEASNAERKPSVLADQLADSLKERVEILGQLSALQQTVDRLQQAPELEMEPAAAEASGAKSPEEHRIRMAAASTKDSIPRRIGDILVEAQIITEEQLYTALAAQKKSSKKRLGSVLVELGYATEEMIGQTIASQLKLEFVRVNESSISADAALAISGRLADRHLCIPLRSIGDKITLAMTNPLDLVAIDDVEKAAGLPVEPVVATATDIKNSIQHFYDL